MASMENTVKIRKLKGATLNVIITSTREFKFRAWIASGLLCMTALVLGAKCNVKTEFKI
jgi:hypothetical protein